MTARIYEFRKGPKKRYGHFTSCEVKELIDKGWCQVIKTPRVQKNKNGILIM